MAVSISKANALTEMVKAFDNQDIKKANKIGKVLCNSIKSDAREMEYSEYILLDKETKQLFPVKIRNKIHKNSSNSKNTTVKIVTEDGIYEIEFSGNVRAVHVKKDKH